MEKDGPYKMDRQNKKMQLCQEEWKKEEYAGTDIEEEKKLAGPLDQKEFPVITKAMRDWNFINTFSKRFCPLS